MEKLEIGQTFDVVEVLDNAGYYHKAFDIGRTTLSIGDKYICNSDYYRCDFKILSMIMSINRLSLKCNQVKPIGKLTIKSIK